MKALILGALLALAVVSPTLGLEAYGPITGTGRCRPQSDFASRYRFAIVAGHDGILEVAGDPGFVAPLRIIASNGRASFIGNPRRIYVRYPSGRGTVTILARRCPPSWYRP